MSKRIWNHPEVPADEKTVAWRSPGQLSDTPEFREWLEREFPQGASELDGEGELETTRRSFLKLMGASTALAGFGLASCRRPEDYIVPYTKAPEWVIPGKATYYASSMPRAQGAVPLVVTTFEGRPTMLAPNRLHPDASGMDVFSQASILDLYSPSRSRQVMHRGQTSSIAEFAKLVSELATEPKGNVAFVFGADDSPTRTRLLASLGEKFAAARFYQYEPLLGNSAQALGRATRLVADFAQADRILSLDCDFVGNDPHGPTMPFFNRRKPEGASYEAAPNVENLNRLYAVESAFTLTGGMADHRLRVAPSQVAAVAAQIARNLGVALPNNMPALRDSKQLKWCEEAAKDLRAHASRTVVLPGSRQPAAVHHLALAINQALDSLGSGKPLRAVATGERELGSIAKLVDDLNAGEIDTLLLLTPANPVYDAPADLKFSEAMAKAGRSIHLGMRTDATAHAATWHVPSAHYLESWSDARSSTGLYSVVQPMILPLYPECVSELELLLALVSEDGALVFGEGENGEASPAYDAVRATFAAMGEEGDGPWRTLLRDGFVANGGYADADFASAPTREADLAAAAGITAPSKNSLEIVFAADSSVYDGRWIDNGWLQEAPDPVTKLTWDNAILVAPQTAKDLGIYDHVVTPQPKTEFLGIEGSYADVGPDGEGENRRSRMVKLKVNGQSLEAPVLISFGQAENTLVLPLGYGQGFDQDDELGRGPRNANHVGLVGVNRGFNAYPLRTQATEYFATGATVEKIAKRYSMALVQEHHSMYGRALAREVSTREDDEKGGFQEQLANVRLQGNDSHAPPNIYLYKPQGSATWDPGKDGEAKSHLSDELHQWGMSIDLSSCMGCNACLVACQAENNIPIVGKVQVAKGREMHWIRLDRYYAIQPDNTFDADNPAFVPQPVACVHCESAPCETVCPVNATVHTEDGLNAMAYNRCIGTRYCANNCPYKARRFNYFDYNKRNPLIKNNLNRGPLGVKQVGEAPHLQKNPNVTVRMRGVMEKCTYCVQRLRDAVIRQKGIHKQTVNETGKSSPDIQVSTKALRVPVDSVKVACQEACPANAITFGNLLDQDASAMFRSKQISRSYDLLHYIGTRPRTSYLARVKNPNPAMPDAPFIGKATINMV